MNSEETDTLIKSLVIAFDSKFEYDAISKLLQEHGSAETVVDILLNKKADQPAKVEKIEENKPLPPVVELPKVIEVPKVEEPSLNSSVFNDLSQSTITAIKQVGRTALEPSPSSFGENDLKFFQERIESLSRQLEDVTIQKTIVEDEKRSALKWCVMQVNTMKDDIKQREEQIQAKDSQIQQLQKQVEDSKTPVEVKMEKYFASSKVKIIEGLDSLSKQLNENMSHVKGEFKNEDEEWVFVSKGVKRLQDLAADLRKEFMELIKPIPPFFSSKLKLSHESVEQVKKPVDWEMQYKDEKEMWVAEKASMESYIKELEQRLQYYEKQQEAPKEQQPQQPQSNPEPPKPAPVIAPPTFVPQPLPQQFPINNPNYARSPFSPFPPQGPYQYPPQQPMPQPFPQMPPQQPMPQHPLPYPYNNWGPNPYRR